MGLFADTKWKKAAREGAFTALLPDGQTQRCTFLYTCSGREQERAWTWLFFSVEDHAFHEAEILYAACFYRPEPDLFVHPVDIDDAQRTAEAVWAAGNEPEEDAPVEIRLLTEPLPVLRPIPEMLRFYLRHTRREARWTVLYDRFEQLFQINRIGFLTIALCFAGLLGYLLRASVWTAYLVGSYYVRSPIAFALFLAWGLPFVLVSALLRKPPYSVMDGAFLGFAPYLIHYIWLTRSYSPLLAGAYSALLAAVLLVCIVRSCRRHRGTRIRFSELYAVCWQALSPFLSVSICLFLAAASFCDNPVLPGEPSVLETMTEPDPVAANAALLMPLRAESWESLGVSERLSVLDTVIAVACTELGVEKPDLYAKVNAMSYEAAFQPDRNSICFNRNMLAIVNAESAVYCVLHECYHAFQHSVTDYAGIDWADTFIQESAYFREARIWKAEFDGYVASNGKRDGIEAYESQTVEASANEYAYDNYLRYFEAVY